MMKICRRAQNDQLVVRYFCHNIVIIKFTQIIYIRAHAVFV